MRFLLDTHAVLWWLSNDRRLGAQSRDIIENPGNDILVSVASLWEIVVKVRVGKLQAEISAVIRALRFLVEDDISEGNLVGLLPDIVDEQIPLYVMFPKGAYMLSKVRAFAAAVKVGTSGQRDCCWKTAQNSRERAEGD